MVDLSAPQLIKVVCPASVLGVAKVIAVTAEECSSIVCTSLPYTG